MAAQSPTNDRTPNGSGRAAGSRPSYGDALESGRVLVFDGATGTNLQLAGLSTDDFGGPSFDGCNELLNATRPDVVAALHRSFLDVGVDVVETNTFGAFAVPLDEYSIPDRAYELSAAGAAIARTEVDAAVARDGRPRWVAGSIGPGTKFPTLGQIGYAALRDAYEETAAGLLDGGVDVVVIETQFDLLGAKAAINGARRAMRHCRREVPLQTQVTIETSGRMLPGTEIGAALATLEGLRVDAIGLNCATGPDEMYEAVRYLSLHSRVPIAVIPNAGLPHLDGDHMVYDLAPQGLADHLEAFVSDFGIQIVGGCCGTTPQHLGAVVDRVRPHAPRQRNPEPLRAAASTYVAASFDQETSVLIIGERTNANGSKAFREAMLAGDLDECVAIGTSQVAEAAHLVDVCVDYVGRDGVQDMAALAARFATDITAPVVLDSTEPEVMQAGLERLGGRCVLNSANLEDGDGPRSRADRVFRLARDHGAAVICLLIDEAGQARTVDWKLRVAHRLHDLATERYGLAPDDLFFDPLTFPLTTGDDDLRRDGIATLEALTQIKAELPGVRTVLGVSNVSFGISPAARRVLNSVFLHEAVDRGLDAAIVHAGKLLPHHTIDEDHRRICRDLIYDQRREGHDPLEELLGAFADAASSETRPVEMYAGLSVEARLVRRIIDGNRRGLDDDLDEALDRGHTALDLINDVLLSGMKTVGDLFGSGDMQLPFVLKSAETITAAVARLEPHLDRTDVSDRGSIVLATVSGDVHDIGKNLVDIILTNNGYRVHNLGTKVPIDTLIDTFEAVEADAIGMSGLLVKSTLVMRDNLDELTRRGLGHVPVILGGAALTRRFVEHDLRSRYPGPVYYGKDAFAGLAAMESVIEDDHHAPEPLVPQPLRSGTPTPGESHPTRAPSVATDNPIPVPPFLGDRIVRSVAVDDIAPFLNPTALFRNQWRYRPVHGESHEAFVERLRPLLAEQLERARIDQLLDPQVVYGYYPANSDGDELILWQDVGRQREHLRLRFPRQRGAPWLCIADFYRPFTSPEVDYAAFHIVTVGRRASERAAELFAADRYTDYLHLHGLSVEMAEALAEYWHHRIRSEWGFADEDGPTLHGLFKQQYRGGRYSWGYPACPDLEDNRTVAELLVARRIGVDVSAETGFQYHPEQTTSALICHHPQAKYFIARPAREARHADE